MKVFYVMVLVLVAGAVPSHGRTESEGTVFNKTQLHKSMSNVTESSSKLVGYRFLYLAMQWPKTFCDSNRHCYQFPRRFTVHGLWPQYDRGHGVNCSSIPTQYPAFNIHLLNTRFVDRLNYHWPDLTRSKDNNQLFWKAEYKKHGSCTFNDQHSYFGLTLDLAVYLEGRLSRAFGPGRNITPGSYNSAAVIKNAVHVVTNFWPTLICIPVGHRIQLLEIRFCARGGRNGLRLTDCDPSIDCRNEQRVYFPPAWPLRP